MRQAVCKNIYEEEGVQVSAIAVAQNDRRLFFCLNSNTISRQSKIISSKMDGSPRVPIINRKVTKIFFQLTSLNKKEFILVF